MKGYNKGDIKKVLIVREQGRTRSNGFKLDKFRLNKDTRKNWSTNKVVDEWNRPFTYNCELFTYNCGPFTYN